MNYGFIIPTCIRSQQHFDVLNECIGSIRKFHDNKIVIIIDFSSQKSDYTSEKSIFNDSNIIIEYGDFGIPADMLTYNSFLKNKYFDRAIILQDSMKILNKIDINNIEKFKYIWHFTNHRLEWHKILEPQTEFNIKNNIETHDDLVLWVLINIVSGEFQKYALEKYHKKYEWIGCFGCLTIMSLKFLQELDKKTNIIYIMSKMNTNRLRRAIESIFSLACQYVTDQDINDSFDGLYYDAQGGGHGLKSNLIEKISLCRE